MSLRTINDAVHYQWMLDLNVEIPKQAWDKISIFGYKFSLNVGMLEHRYEIVHRWYLTPLRLSCVYSGGNYKCWKCGWLNVTYLHVCWNCVIVNKFWYSMHKEIEEGVKIPVPFSPRMYLLCWFLGKEFVTNRYVLVNLITAASMLLAKCGKWRPFPK